MKQPKLTRDQHACSTCEKMIESYRIQQRIAVAAASALEHADRECTETVRALRIIASDAERDLRLLESELIQHYTSHEGGTA